jgi:thiamine pyridinylase
MRIRFLPLITAILVSATTITVAHAAERYCADSGPRMLRVEMYPFVPNPDGMALKMKELFEAGCPGLDLQLTRNQNYYSTDNSGVLSSDADVYEVDSVFFDDFVKHKTPKIPSQAVVDAAGPVVPFAQKIATVAGVQFGIPHWLCSDFLIYPKSLSQIGDIKTPDDATRVFAQLGKGPLMDLKGSSTLGELYLSILVAHYGSATDALKRLDPDHLDSYAVSVLQSFVAMEPAGFGRDAAYHAREGFYPRQFARHSGSAFVGYSEDTYYILSEAADSCLKNECLQQDDLNVTAWPFAKEGAKPVAWVDMYMLDSRLSDTKLRDAEAFVKFMTSASTYDALLVPPDGPPRYLLPARDDVYADSATAPAKLYAKFRAVIDAAVPVTGENLNFQLHQIASKLEKDNLLENH